MQITYNTHLSTSAYIKQSEWQNARLKTCPANPGGDDRLHRHGTYTRKYPDGMRVARYYCRSCRTSWQPAVRAPWCQYRPNRTARSRGVLTGSSMEHVTLWSVSLAGSRSIGGWQPVMKSGHATISQPCC